MANMYGADVQQLTDLASAMDQASSQLSATRQSVSAKVQQSSWVGPDAERFRSTWSSTNNARVASASQLLSDAAVTLRKNAAEQTQASAASSASVTSAGPDGGGSGADMLSTIESIGSAGAWVVGLTGHLGDFINGIPRTYELAWAGLNSADRSAAGILASAADHGTSDAAGWIRALSTLSKFRTVLAVSEVAGGAGTVIAVGMAAKDWIDPKSSTTTQTVEDTGAAVFAVGAQFTDGWVKVGFSAGGVVWGVGSDIYNANTTAIDNFARMTSVAVPAGVGLETHAIAAAATTASSVTETVVHEAVKAGESTTEKLFNEATTGFAKLSKRGNRETNR